MSGWAHIHWADVRGRLSAQREWIDAGIRTATSKISTVVVPEPTDIVVCPSPNVIPEKGMMGFVDFPGRIVVWADPDHEALAQPAADVVERLIVHETHHVLRNDGPGFGLTLGEALVSEGLAGQFVRQLCGPPEEPWETAVSHEDMQAYAPEVMDNWAEEHDHSAWFFGTADKPRWLGYSYGFAIVGAYLAANPDQTAGSLANADAKLFLPYVEL